jgi:tripartite-type tricarboxylate transporter receptor subunit TctC
MRDGKRRKGNEMRGFLILLFCTLIVSAAAADNYPTRPIRLLIPFPPAGITDLSGRIVAEALREKFKQPIIVENKPGANGVIGLKELLRAEPDGYTLMVGQLGSMVLNYAMDPKVGFDPMKDVVPIASTAEYATTMVVNKSLPVNSVQEFVAYAKERQGQLTYGSTGEGSMANLSTMLFMRQTGVKMVHAPYKGGPLALNDLIAGHIQLIIEVSPVVNEQVLAGTIKGFAVTSPYRQPMLPNVPTFTEAGVSGVVVTGWLGIYGPPGLPNDVREKLGAAVVEVVKQPDVAKKLRAIGFEPTAQGVKEFTDFHAAEVKRWVAFYTEVGLRK